MCLGDSAYRYLSFIDSDGQIWQHTRATCSLHSHTTSPCASVGHHVFRRVDVVAGTRPRPAGSIRRWLVHVVCRRLLALPRHDLAADRSNAAPLGPDRDLERYPRQGHWHQGRGLHSFTSQLNLSAFYVAGDARRG